MLKKILLQIYRKTFTFLVVLWVCNIIFPGIILAQEVVLTGTQPELSSTETAVNNNAQVENNVDQIADTGNNSTAIEPTPTPIPLPESSLEESSLPEPPPEPDQSNTLNNKAQVENDVESVADSGNNSISQPEKPVESTQEATDSAKIDTGNAVSVVEADNNINSTEVNSQVLHQTLNIFLSGDVDLTKVPYIIAEAVFAQDNQDLQVVNVAVYKGNNFVYLANNISSLAQTGSNSITGPDQGTVKTGDAYSVVSVVNRVNTTIIDSAVHIVTINIFGTADGNIILPELKSDGQCCGKTTETNNQAEVENNISSLAVSGQNEIQTTGSGIIDTGSAKSIVNMVNLVNTNLSGVLFHYLFVNNFGSWDGSFLGWDEFLQAAGGSSLSLSSVTGSGGNNDGDCCLSDVSIENRAFVYNNISSSALSGGNFINSNNASIQTGKAYSAISLINLVNSNIIDSIGFFGFVNIFGELKGDIGGESKFQTEEVISEVEVVANNQNQDQGGQASEESSRQMGGELKITNFSHNVGEFVLPGDTVTFFVTAKNIGTGTVYRTKARISFIVDGMDMGGASFDLGDIDPGKGMKLTTGLVLSKNIKPGTYIARVKVWGEVGEDSEVSDFSDSTFFVGGTNPTLMFSENFEVLGEALASEDPQVEVLKVEQRGLTTEQKMWILLGIFTTTYLILRIIRQRRVLAGN